MEALGFSKWALVLCLSLFWREALPIIVNEIHGGYLEPKTGSAPCNKHDNKLVLFVHTKACENATRSEFRSALGKIASLKQFTFKDRSIKLNFIKPFKSGECWSCLGRCHLRRIKNNQQNIDDADQDRFENFECYKHEILLKLLMDHAHSGASNFEDLSFSVKNRKVAMRESQKNDPKGSGGNNKVYNVVFKVVRTNGGRKNITFG